MKHIVLTAETCPTKECLHRYIADQLGFPSWYGENLDALFDCLTDVNEDISIHVPNVDGLEAVLGPYARRLMRVLVEASSENPCIQLTAD